MALQRRSRFGFPPPAPGDSHYTSRQVPLSTGPNSQAAWPLLPPGSASSMVNWLPINGKLVPRSRLSSLNTLRTMAEIRGIAPRFGVSGAVSTLWLSDATRHGIINSTGSISVASFTSAFGLGVSGVAEAAFLWQYAQVYYPGDADDYVLVAAPGIASYGTLTITYFAGTDFRTSYLTSAPQTQCIGAFDNYLIAWNITDSTGNLPNRVQWCQRGSPSNWTGEGSGFEDLLEMRGIGSRVIGTQDNRLILFSSHEVWYGLPATYPAQFQFYPLDRTVGVMGPMTAVETDLGIIFLGSDLHLRLLPRGGGASTVIAPSLQEKLQHISDVPTGIGLNTSFGIFDPIQRLYYLYVDQNLDSVTRGFVINVDTGEWGRIHHTTFPYIGCSVTAPVNSTFVGSMYAGNSSGTVSSYNSKLDSETVTAIWDSPVIANDLPANYKQITQVDVDYRSFSTGTVSFNISQNGGKTFHLTQTMTLPPAHIAGRETSQQYIGGAFPMMRITSTSTGVELHRLDVTMNLGGRRA